MNFDFENIDINCKGVHSFDEISAQMVAQAANCFYRFTDFVVNLLFPALELVCYQ